MIPRLCLAVVCAVGAGRIAFYYLIHEPVLNQQREIVGSEFVPLRPLLKGVRRIGYVSDQGLDDDPLRPRQFDLGNMMYARAQYALAPTVLAHSHPDLPLVLANFADPAALDRLIASGSYEVRARTGPTSALLGRR